jgi:hypothetical protein
MPKDLEAHDPLEARVGRLEGHLTEIGRTVGAFENEIRTRRLVIVDDTDHPWIVGEVSAEAAELRLELPTLSGTQGPELLLFALAGTHPGPVDLGPGIGLQLRAHGQAIFELDAWPHTNGVWHPHVHLGGE